eukprot:847038-Pyramimonas_sp.AAC.1
MGCETPGGRAYGSAKGSRIRLNTRKPNSVLWTRADSKSALSSACLTSKSARACSCFSTYSL